jgi:hypothetical protein
MDQGNLTKSVDFDKAKAMDAHMKLESGTPDGIENTSVEALLVARKPL